MTRLINISYFLFVTLIGYSKTTDDNQTILTNDEVNDLVFLYEEEKLARDVYLFSYKKYDLNFFETIAGSEQNHMNKVLSFLEKHGINKIVSNSGEFSNHKIQELYNKLTKQSEQSLIEALKVGATIEDLDIYDIESLKKRTDNSLILAIYAQLICGSKNHLRMFNKEILKKKSSCEAQYISKKLFKSIVKSSNKSCGNKSLADEHKKKGKEQGKGKGKGQGKGQMRGKCQGQRNKVVW